EALRRQHTVLGVADAREGFSAGELLAPKIDLWLVPELDPVVLEGFGQSDLDPRRRRSVAELELGHDLLDGRGLERLLEHREHSDLHLLAGLLDRIEDGRAAAADQLHVAGEARLAQRLDRLDS